MLRNVWEGLRVAATQMPSLLRKIGLASGSLVLYLALWANRCSQGRPG